MAYFSTVSYGDGLYGIWEALGVGSFLLVGEERALLMDTGYGFGDIAAYLRTITDKPVVVANTHVHPDHSGGNDRFERVLVGVGDLPKLRGDTLRDEFDAMIGFAVKIMPPLKLLVKHYAKADRGRQFQTEYVALAEGETISLGGRDVTVREMPGHTPGSVVFLDSKTKTVFVGDAVNRGMFLYMEDSPRLREYAARLDELAKLKGFERLLSSHSKKPAPFAFAGYYADFLRRVDVSKIKMQYMPLSEERVARYREKSHDYGSVSVFFRRDPEE